MWPSSLCECILADAPSVGSRCTASPTFTTISHSLISCPEPVYRVAEKEWKDFVEAFTDAIIEVDPEVPPLPPKDVIHRIYRDVRSSWYFILSPVALNALQIRFSNDKTPYKQGFSASFSRSGRKGTFAGCTSLPPPLEGSATDRTIPSQITCKPCCCVPRYEFS